MDEQTIVDLIANMGFAIGVAAFLIVWLTSVLNKKLDKIIETQEMISKTLSEIVATEKLIVELLKGSGGGKRG